MRRFEELGVTLHDAPASEPDSGSAD
jgi:hypothetical protein